MFILHLITALESGGAEKVLFETIKRTRNDYQHKVIVLSKRGTYVKQISALGVSIEKLSISVIWKWFRSKDKCIVHSYLYHTHIASLLFKTLGFDIIWAIHSSQPPSSRSTLIFKLCGLLSYFVPNKIVYVSMVARNQHQARGFNKARDELIYNGVNINKSEKPQGKQRITDANDINIVMVARYHPIKDFDRFFSIVCEVLKVEPSFKFHLIGKGNTMTNHSLANDLRKYGLHDKINLLSEIENVHNVLHQFDLLVSTSKSESFALTILEALLAGTNVSTIDLPIMTELFKSLAPNTGEMEDSEIASSWIQKARCAPPDELVKIARYFSIEIMIDKYQDLYSRISTAKSGDA